MNCVNDIFEYLNTIAPVSLKMDFDNVGILIGDKTQKLEKCLVALDVTDEVIDEAVTLGAELIVSHHPIIFNPLKSVLNDDILGRKIIKLIRNNISVICMHTNLDIAEGGVNDALMGALSARVTGFLEESGIDSDGNPTGCGRVGELYEEMDFDKFLKNCKQTLKANGLRYYYAGNKVKKLAVMGGSGGSSVALAKELGCDTYVTADIKYNSFLDAKELGINLIDADHFCTENVVIPVLYEKLKAKFSDVDFHISQRLGQTVQFI